MFKLKHYTEITKSEQVKALDERMNEFVRSFCLGRAPREPKKSDRS